jgi:hypothetical protein
MTDMIRYTILSLALGYAGLAWAISIYDVIELSRDFSDEEVVAIIRSTRSTFELTAEDIPRLKNLGVSEAIIRAMLITQPAESTEKGPFLNATGEHDQVSLAESAVQNDIVIIPAISERSSHDSPVLISRRFSVKLVAEEAAGGHLHAFVTLNGLPILILRDEGGFQSIEKRGETVVSNLERAMEIGDGHFRVQHAKGTELVVYQGADLREVPIITINHRDVRAYDVRSERRLNSDILAAYWAALLNDYWAIALLHQAPSRLVNLHRGDALMMLFKLVSQSESDRQTDLGAAVQQLPGTIQRHLERLARAVPDDFDTSPEHVAEAR